MDSVTFGNLAPGVFTVKMSTEAEPQLALLTFRRILRLLDGSSIRLEWPDRGRLVEVEWVRPLERQGGISGAMYWGATIR